MTANEKYGHLWVNLDSLEYAEWVIQDEPPWDVQSTATTVLNRPTITVESSNKGTQIREIFPYLGQNSKIFEIRESLNLPYLTQKSQDFWYSVKSALVVYSAGSKYRNTMKVLFP